MSAEANTVHDVAYFFKEPSGDQYYHAVRAKGTPLDELYERLKLLFSVTGDLTSPELQAEMLEEGKRHGVPEREIRECFMGSG